MTIIDKLRTMGPNLNTLADWFDLKYPNDTNTEVQTDLRMLAHALPALLRVAEAAVDWSNAEFGQDLNECAALRDAVDALSALEVQS